MNRDKATRALAGLLTRIEHVQRPDFAPSLSDVIINQLVIMEALEFFLAEAIMADVTR